MAKIIAVANQKGGVGKTTTTVNLGVGLARQKKKVLMIDADPQGSMSICLGIDNPDNLEHTVTDILINEINEDETILDVVKHHEENVDFIPANIELSGLEVQLANIVGRETVLRDYIDKIKNEYDYIIIDCMPSLGMLTINALSCADSVLIPVQAAYLPVKGLEQLIKTIGRIKKKINPKLEIEGILITMVDNRTNYSKDIIDLLSENYGEKVKIFKNEIPNSVRASEISVEGVSIFKHDPKGKVASAYLSLVKEVLSNE